MAKGKNKLVRWLRVFVDGYNLSGDARNFASMDNMMEGVDLTGWSEEVRWGIADKLRQVGVRGFQALLNDTAQSGAHSVLKNPGSPMVVSFLFGGGAEPDFGDPAYLLGSMQVSAPAGLDGQAHVLTADFLPNGRTSVNPFGVVLHPETNINATTLGDSVDNGAATSGGWHANLHITATSSGDYEFRIEQSATGAFSGEETTLATFTLDGSAIGSEELSGSGSVAQHVRFVATKTAGSCTPVCVFARN